MRTMLMFDLPSVTSKEQKIYRKFLLFLKSNGFYMLQESVYVKLSIDQQNVDSTISLVKRNAPENGSILIFTMTEKQFSSMQIISGEIVTKVLNDDKRTVVI